MSGTYIDNTAGYTETTGTGDYLHGGDIATFESMSALTDGDSYSMKIRFIDIADGTDWERGLYTWDSGTSTFVRTTIYASSNGDAAVNWGAGQKIMEVVEDTAMAADMEKMVEGATKKILTSTERNDIANSKTKLALITVTQPVDLDTMEAEIAAASSGMTYKGNWDASTGVFPGGGTTSIGDFYYVGTSGIVGGVEFTVGDNVVAVVANASTTVYTGNWSKHDQSDSVQAVVGLTGNITQVDMRDALGLYNPQDAVHVGSGDDSIIVMVCPGNSQTGGWKGGDYPTTLTANPDVYVWQAPSSDTQSAVWQNVDHSGVTSDPGIYQMLGYCGGNVATNWLFDANRLQEQTGKKVFCIVGYQGGAPSVLFDPVRGDTNNEYDFSGTYTSNNNMWYWISAAVNAALAALQAGTSGAPAAYPSKDFVDLVYGDIATGDCVWAFDVPVYFPDTVWTIDQININYPAAIQNFIDGAEGNSASLIGGWAKPWYTKWFFNDVPVGVDNTSGTVSIKSVFDGFTGNYSLINEARSLVWGVSCPSGLLTASDTTLGTIDNVHWNSYSQAHIGAPVADAYLYQPLQRSRVITPGADFNNELTANLDGNGFNIASVANITITGEFIGASFYSNYLGGGNALFTGGAGFGTGVLRSGVADGASAIGFTVTTNATYAGASAKLMSVQNNGDEKAYIDKGGALVLDGEILSASFNSNYLSGGNALFSGGAGFGTGTLLSGVANAVSAIAFTMNTNNAMAASGTKVLSIQNAGTELAYLDKVGSWIIDGEIITATFNSNYLGGGVALFAGGLSTGTGVFNSGVASGVSAIGFALNTNNNFTHSGALLLSLQNNAVQKLSVDKDGNMTLTGISNGSYTTSNGTFSSAVPASGSATGFTFTTATLTGGDLIFNIKNNTTSYLKLTYDGTLKSATGALASEVATSGTAKGFTLTTATLSSAGDKALSIMNNATEIANVSYAGSLVLGDGTNAVGITHKTPAGSTSATLGLLVAPANSITGTGRLMTWWNSSFATMMYLQADGMLNVKGFAAAYRTVSGTSDTITTADSLVTYSSTSTVTATLPSAVTYPGFEIEIKKTGASGTVNVTSVSSQTFDGSASPVAISTQYHVLRLKSDGANWLKLKTGAP